MTFSGGRQLLPMETLGNSLGTAGGGHPCHPQLKCTGRPIHHREDQLTCAWDWLGQQWWKPWVGPGLAACSVLTHQRTLQVGRRAAAAQCRTPQSAMLAVEPGLPATQSEQENLIVSSHVRPREMSSHDLCSEMEDCGRGVAGRGKVLQQGLGAAGQQMFVEA